MKTSMRQMVASKLDPVEDFKRALRHAAHLYTHAQAPGAKQEYADELYRAARALVVAELIQASKP